MNMERHALNQLDLNEQQAAALAQAGYQYTDELTDITFPKLKQTCQLESEEAQLLFAKLDYFYDRLRQSQSLCPTLPPSCYDLELDFLDMDTETLILLSQAKLHTLGELAFMERHQLMHIPGMTTLVALDVEFALSAFVDAYRGEDILLVEEEAAPPALNHPAETDTEEMDGFQNMMDNIDAELTEGEEEVLSNEAFEQLMSEYESTFTDQA